MMCSGITDIMRCINPFRAILMRTFHLSFLGTLIFPLLFSCADAPTPKETIEHKFFYSNGDRITDSLTIKAVSREIDSILILHENEPCKVFTALHSQNLIDPVSLDIMRTQMREALMDKNPKHQGEIEQISDAWILDVGIVVMDNATGQAIVHQNTSKETDIISHNFIGPGTRKFYGILMALDKGYGVDDVYIYKEIRNGEIRETKFPIKSLFAHSYGIIPRYPHQEYTYAEWYNLDHKFRWDLKLYMSTHKDYPIWTESNLVSLVRSVATVKNQGEYKYLSPVDYINNGLGETVFKKHQFVEKVITDTTNAKMLQLFEYARTRGISRGVAHRMELPPNDILYFGESGESFDWLVFANDRYTIGIITRNIHRYKNEYNQNRKIYMSGYKWRSPRQCVPFLKYVIQQLADN